MDYKFWLRKVGLQKFIDELQILAYKSRTTKVYWWITNFGLQKSDYKSLLMDYKLWLTKVGLQSLLMDYKSQTTKSTDRLQILAHKSRTTTKFTNGLQKFVVCAFFNSKFVAAAFFTRNLFAYIWCPICWPTSSKSIERHPSTRGRYLMG